MKLWSALVFLVTIVAAAGSDNVEQTGPRISPPEMEFGVQDVGSAGEAQVLKLANPGSLELAINSILASGIDFSQSNDCGTWLGPGAECGIRLVFTPATIGPRIGQLSVVSSRTVRAVPLSGTGR